ncbi:Hermansky-Pudlak syndrome 4 protein isoform X1 [Meleagris gallopavo]|uniref:HPS4 biosis of lysosomal organelles complex 3 subunit 2 n=2 Tax=Meleagris gallopavo TaxID=9103 RepID=G1N533_MELGA|nr:Hermansky-Pudlak syndrome 4 protein isoform X1 [Meleagris gallopavo]
MARPQRGPAPWWNYFFLYDGSKVKEEGDPTSAGICYFYPSQTLPEQQELLCGQIAGVVHCMTEISGVPPSLIRLRKLKFAVIMDGDYLWVLGCAVDLPDISCRRFLEQLISLFTFYNGSVHQAYMEFSQEELKRLWDRYIEYIQKSTNDLHKIFNSLWNLDKTKVDPLLLLKAALILQTCQRSPRVLAGCIIYKGLIVSTQLPPPLTAKVLLQGSESSGQSEPGGEEQQEPDSPLPQGVRIIPVFLTEDEVSVLRGEWMNRSTMAPASPREEKNALSSPAVSESTGIHINQDLNDISVLTEQASSAATPEDVVQSGSFANTVPLKGSPKMEARKNSSPTAELSSPSNKRSEPSRKASFSSDGHEKELLGPSNLRAALYAQTTDSYLEGFSFPNPYAKEQESQSAQEPLVVRVEQHSFQSCLADNAGPTTCSAVQELSRRKSSEQGEQGTLSQNSISAESDAASGSWNLDCPTPVSQSELGSKNQPVAVDVQEGLHSATAENMGCTQSGEQDWPQSGRPAAQGTESGKHCKFIQMSLYVHSIKGLVLSLLAEDCLRDDQSSVEDVYHSSLASLNGLEVHLRETLPRDFLSSAKATYSFTHYDCIQNVLTANVPHPPGPLDRHFLRAATLIHSDFNQLPTVSEVIVRNASTAVYACRNPVQETYFQQLGAPLRNSGAPNPQDSAFSLPNKAKQKLLKHGVNLL